MKQFLILILTVILALAVAISVSAAPVVFYLDTLVDGSVDQNGTKTDLSSTIISGGTLFENNVKVGAEYGFGDRDGEDVTLWSIKGGYRFVDARATKIDAIVALLNIDATTNELNSTLLGFDFTQYFSTKLFLSATIAYSLDGSVEIPAYALKDNDVPVTLYRLKVIYLINDSWGASLGYTDLSYEVDKASLDISLGGLNLGLMYKF